MNITHEDRVELLKAYNDLRSIVQTLHECKDIFLSDLGKLEDLECLLHRALKFVPPQDEDGRSMHYAQWVLAELDDDEL